MLETYGKEALPVLLGGTLAQSQMDEALLQALKTRYANMASFKLPPKPVSAEPTVEAHSVET